MGGRKTFSSYFNINSSRHLSLRSLQQPSKKVPYIQLSEDQDVSLSILDERGRTSSKLGTTASAWFRSDASFYDNSDNYEYAPANDGQPASARGWRKAVILAAAGTVAILLMNISLLSVAMAKYGADAGIGIIHTGNCALVKRWNTVLHLLINVLSTGLLAASNFTMQCLSAPTRMEIDIAHSKRKVLDIGIPSFRNLFSMKPTKALLWFGLALSTLPLHLLWNSVVFTALGAHEMSYIVVEQSFFDMTPFQQPNDTRSCGEAKGMPSLGSFQAAYFQGSYSQRLDPSECIYEYTKPFLTDRRNLIAVTQPKAGIKMSPGCVFGQEQSILGQVFPDNDIRLGEANVSYWLQPAWIGSSVLAISHVGVNYESYQFLNSFTWLCDGYDDYRKGLCDRETALSKFKQHGALRLRPKDLIPLEPYAKQSYEIEYCLSEVAVPQVCQLQFSSYILYAVIACNVVKALCMLLTVYTLWNLEQPILVTVGDAVMSFLQHPDRNTKGLCLINRYMVKNWITSPKQNSGLDRQQCPPRHRHQRLFSATSKTRWLTTIGLCMAYLLGGVVLLMLSLEKPLQIMDISQVWKLGLGAMTPSTILGQGHLGGSFLVINSLAVNSFQLALSIVYFLYNSLFTAQYGALEWAAFASGARKPLRVTLPQGAQISTYWLQLPYRYAVPLIIMSVIMHFLTSQSVFLAIVNWYKVDGSMDYTHYISTIGFSPIAILVTICVGGALIIVQISNSLRPLRSNIPTHCNSSVIISAVCHVDEARTDTWDGQAPEINNGDGIGLKPVMWGATVQPSDTDEVGHCSFTENVVEMPTPGMWYS